MKKHYIKLVVAMGGIAAATMGIAINSMGVFYEPVADHLGVSAGTFGTHTTVVLFTMGFASLIVPNIMKKMSFKSMIFLGMVFVVLSTLGMGVSTSMVHFYILSVIKGVGVVLFSMIPIMALLNQWFVKRKGTVTSIVVSFSGLLGALISPLLAVIIEKIGWQQGYFFVAIVILILILPSLLFTYTFDPKDMDAKPYGEVDKPIDTITKSQEFAYKNITFGLFVMFSFVVNFVVGFVQFLPSFATSFGYTLQLGATMLSLAQIGNVASKIIIGFLVDLFGSFFASLLMIALGLVATGMLYLGQNPNMYLIGSLLFGVIYALASVSIPLLIEKFFGKEHYGKAYSIVQMFMYCGNALSQTVFGKMFDFFGDYLMVLLIVMLLFIFLILSLCTVNYQNKNLVS